MDKLTKATHEGLLHIGENTLSCAVLDDGTRILSQSAVYKALDRSVRSKSRSGNRADQMPSFLDANNIQPFVSQELKTMIKEVEYIGLNGKNLFGYNARIIPKVAKVYLDARRAGVLTKKQLPVADACEILTTALADVGITSLVDLATGFVELKVDFKEEVARFLQKSLSLEPAQWVKTFNDEFFEMIFKMKGWNWTKSSKRPAVVGHYINNIVYSRIAPNVLSELQRINPKIGKERRSKHHQHLTGDFGHPLLKEHLAGLIALGRASKYNWDLFLGMVDTAYPKYGQTLELDFAIEYDKKKLEESNKPISDFDNKLKQAIGFNPKKTK